MICISLITYRANWIELNTGELYIVHENHDIFYSETSLLFEIEWMINGSIQQLAKKDVPMNNFAKW